jgi:hypothetical protein
MPSIPNEKEAIIVIQLQIRTVLISYCSKLVWWVHYNNSSGKESEKERFFDSRVFLREDRRAFIAHDLITELASYRNA